MQMCVHGSQAVYCTTELCLSVDKLKEEKTGKERCKCAVKTAAELNSIRDKRVYNEVYKSEADAKIISGKWVLKPHKARYVPRGCEEDAKDEDVFASTTMTASVRMLLSQAKESKTKVTQCSQLT